MPDSAHSSVTTEPRNKARSSTWGGERGQRHRLGAAGGHMRGRRRIEEIFMPRITKVYIHL